MAVGKAVHEGLVVGVVDAIEVAGDIAVAPFVAGQSGLVALVVVVPDGGGAAAALDSEIHGRDVGGRSVGVEDNIQQVGLGQRSRECDGVDLIRGEGIKGVVFIVNGAESAVVALHDALNAPGRDLLYDFAVAVKEQVVRCIDREGRCTDGNER